MNWSKTKSIFIICFLLLDAFLIFEMYLRQHDEGIEGPIEKVGRNSFQIDTDMPATPTDVTFLRGTRTDFSKAKRGTAGIMNGVESTVRQKVAIENDGMQLHGTFVRPIIGNTASADLRKELLSMVYQGENYTYWRTDQNAGTIDFVQLFNNRPVFISKRSNLQMLEFMIGSKQVTGYRQSYFTFKRSNSADVISAERAISNLGENTDLLDSDHGRPKIKLIELGYVNLVGDAGSDPLIFIPAWHIMVQTKDGKAEFFVNAMSGNVQTMD